ncbi:WD40 repeat-like protein [Backusella circina FSU 941]|nr:WD40 repeat-like protein [Backusella circina FSU 941]
MSMKLQQCLRDRRYYSKAKPTWKQRRRNLAYQVYTDRYTISHMAFERELYGHTGCINTLDWSSQGDKLLTGSDDTYLCIYQPFDNYHLRSVITTGHSANIFSAKFMPHTSDNIVISGAGDSEIRIFDLTLESSLSQMYVCHSDQIKQICVYPDNPNEFLTCSQDGNVRHFDIRTPHICSRHIVRKFITAESKLSKQTLIPEGPNIQQGCRKPIVNYSKYNIELNGMSIHHQFPHYFAIAGTHDYIYLHDRRMVGESGGGSEKGMMDATKCIKRFTSTSDTHTRPNKRITSCKFGRSKSSELIGSWSSGGIYLFDINDSPLEAPRSESTVSTSSKRKRSLSMDSELPDENPLKKWNKCVRLFRDYEWEEASAQLNILIDQYQPNTLFSASTSFSDAADAALIHTCALLLSAAIDLQIESSNLVTLRERLQRIEQTAPPTWRTTWCFAVGYWVISGGALSIEDGEERRHFLDQSHSYIQRARREYMCEMTDAHSEEPGDHFHFRKILDSFETDLKKTYVREGFQRENDANSSTMGHIEGSRWKWLDYMYVKPPNGNLPMSPTASPLSTASLNLDEMEMPDTRMIDDDELSIYTHLVSSRGIIDMMYRGGIGGIDSDDDDDSDIEAYTGYHNSGRKYINNTDSGIVKHRAKYTGHSNIETAKDVEFYGPNDEYILSGSDGGYLFIWDKKTKQVVQILHADDEIVNVAKGHPTLPILAVSGIDFTTKIFTPTSRPILTSKLKEPHNPASYSSSSHLFEEEELVARNRENNINLGDEMYITRSMIAALSRLERRYSRRRRERNLLLGIEDGDEEDDDDDTSSFDSILAL